MERLSSKWRPSPAQLSFASDGLTKLLSGYDLLRNKFSSWRRRFAFASAVSRVSALFPQVTIDLLGCSAMQSKSVRIMPRPAKALLPVNAVRWCARHGEALRWRAAWMVTSATMTARMTRMWVSKCACPRGMNVRMATVNGAVHPAGWTARSALRR